MPKTITDAKNLRGVFPALFTPLNNDDPKRLNNSIDYKKAERMIDDLIDAGVSGLVPVGTTGQSATVTPQQHIDFIKFAADYAGSRVPIIAGTGSNCTRETIHTINKVHQSVGSLTCLCVTGYYNNPPQAGLHSHFETITQETDASIVLYNVPGRTQSYLEPETIIELSKNPRIIGLKQAVDFKNPGSKRDDTLKILSEINKKEFAVMSGEDDSLFTILSMGGQGLITATGNIPEASKIFLKCIEAFENGDTETAEKIQETALLFVKAVFIRKNPIPLADMFNSPIYQPLISSRETENGEAVYAQLMDLIDKSAPSLKKYFDI